MKKAIFTIMLAMASVAINAQTFTAKTSNAGAFNTEASLYTDEDIIIEGQHYELWMTESGSKYVKLTSLRTGNEYPLWIGDPTEYTFEGRTVYQSRNGSYCVYVISANSGNPYAKWLNMAE